MGTPDSSPNVGQEETLSLFSQLDGSRAPLSATEVAAKLECSEQIARQNLETLAERGELQTRRVDEQRQVWWAADDLESPEQNAERQEFIRAVEEYAIFMLAPDGTVISWNEGAERIKGYTEDEIVGTHFSTFYTDDDLEDSVPDTNLDIAADQGRVEDEGWRVRKDGSKFWADVVITAIRDENGTLQGFTKVTRDKTEQQEYEQQLRQERDLTEQILETVPVSICVINADGEFVRANSRMLARAGLERSDLGDASVDSWEIYDASGEPIPAAEWPWVQAIETGEPVHNFRCQVDLSDDDRRWLSMDAALLEDDSHDGERVVVSVDDITDRKRHERQLRREYKQTEKLLRTAPIAIAVQNDEGSTVMANQRAQEALGLSEQEIIEEPENADDWEVYDETGKPIPPSETPTARALETGEPVFNEEVIIDPPNNDRLQFQLNAAPVFGPDGTIERVITAGEDITELKNRERQLEQRKTELETELSEILGRVSDAFYALDDEWQFTHLNGQAAEIMQRSTDELLTQEVWEVFPDAAESVYWESLHTAMDTQEPVSFEVYEEGIDAWLEFNVYPSESGLSIYFQDITDRKQRERELAKYETIVKTVEDGIYVKDEEGYFTMVNDAYADMTGYAREELVGEHATLVIDEDTIEHSKEKFIGGAGNPAIEAELQTEDGGRLPVEGTFTTLRTDDGDREEVGVVRDITERKEREQALRERERQLQEYKEYTDDILDAVDDVFYLLDENGELQRWNKTVSDVTGYSNAEIESMSVLEFFDETAQEKIAAAIAEGFETEAAQVVATVLTKDGERIPYEFVASTLKDPDGNSVLAGLGRDITDRREYERKLEESNERLEQFAYAASHDLQEPLRMVSSYLQLIERRYSDVLDDDGEEFIEFAVDGAERMRAMIDGLLKYSRVETQGDPFEPIDLEAVFSDVRDDLQLQIAESDAEITVDSLPRVNGDPNQLRQVFQNLLDNAIDYSGDEPPQIRVAVERDDDEWVISVSDNGIGIDPDDADRIFEVFHRLHTQEERPGTGIGLALCQRIVERHGGDIWVNSEPGEGATFSFTLPVASDLDT